MHELLSSTEGTSVVALVSFPPCNSSLVHGHWSRSTLRGIPCRRWPGILNLTRKERDTEDARRADARQVRFGRGIGFQSCPAAKTGLESYPMTSADSPIASSRQTGRR